MKHVSGVAPTAQPSDEQVTRALRAAHLFEDSPQARKDMRAALIAAAGVLGTSNEQENRHGD